MKVRHSLMIATLTAFLAISINAQAGKKDIVDTAVEAGSFKTLAAALQSADLIDILKGEGPFTVFAPTDEAFSKLPEGTVETLLKPKNRDKLVDIVTYHVVSGKVPSKVAVGLDKATALNKKEITIQKKDGSLFLNQSKVIQTDIDCSNGVIHVIESVLLPSENDLKTVRSTKAAQDLIHVAIQKGAPLYNHGNHEACASVYEMTARALVAMPREMVSDSDRRTLHRALAKAEKSSCMTTDSWTFRRAFDEMLLAQR